VANPFGPLQEGRFFNYILNSIKKGQTPQIQDPWTIQDNILVESLSRIYLGILNENPSKRPKEICPSQYLESNLQYCCRLMFRMNSENLVSKTLELAFSSNPKKNVSINAWLNTDTTIYAEPFESEWLNFISDKEFELNAF
jgi:hypothetical protein